MKKLLLVFFFLIVGWGVWKYHSTHHPDLPGYQSDAAEMEREHEKIYGAPVESGEIEKGFADAQAHIHRAEYHDAIVFFRSATKTAALPIFFNDLGTLYEAAGDWPHAYAAYHQALERDGAYKPALDNLNALKAKAPPEETQIETEPNNTYELANEIALNLPVAGEITAGMDDTDVFSIVTPPGARDLLRVELENHSKFLEPRLRVLDSDGVLFHWDVKTAAGESITQTITAKPNTLLNIEVSGENGTNGAYRLTVHPLKAFDAYEPNETVFQATPLALGKTLEANIMDGDDNDYYSIRPEQSGDVTIEIENRSATLSPGLTLLATDKSTIGFGPDVQPGWPVKMTLKVDGGHLYYIQVWSQHNTSGAYAITAAE